MSRPLLISLGMHALFAVIAMFGLPMLGRDLPEEMPIVRLEIVRTVPKTNLIEGDKPSTAKEEQQATVSKKPPPPMPPPPPPLRTASSKPAPPPQPKPKPAVSPKVEAAEILPDKPKPKPKKTEVAQVTPKLKSKPKAKSNAKAKPSPSVLPKPKPVKRPDRKKPAPTVKPANANDAVVNQMNKLVKDQKKRERAASGVLQNLAEAQLTAEDTVKPAKAKDAVANQLNKLVKDQKKREQAASGVLQNLAEAQLAAEDAEKARKTQERKEAADTVTKTLSAVAGNAVKAPDKKSLSVVGIDDIARIQQHVSKCWQPPLGAAGNDTLKVDIFVFVDEFGNVKRAEIEDKLRFRSDSYFKASAIAGRRAIVECSPLPIPPEKFDQLKEFTFSFDPAFLSR